MKHEVKSNWDMLREINETFKKGHKEYCEKLVNGWGSKEMSKLYEKEMEEDAVVRPNHYCIGGIETIDYIRAKLTPEEFAGYCKGNIIKYVSRAEYKGKESEDLKKANVYLGWLIERCV